MVFFEIKSVSGGPSEPPFNEPPARKRRNTPRDRQATQSHGISAFIISGLLALLILAFVF